MTLNLEKLDRWNHLRGTGLDELEWKGSDDEGFSDSESDSDEDSTDGEEEEEEALAALEDAEDDEVAKEARHAALTQAEKVGAWNLPPVA